MRKIIILSAATLVLSSCGIYNKYKPVSEVPEGLYGSESVAAADTANFGNLSWQEVFTDPSLQNLIDSALVRNTDMQTAHLRVKEAEATLLTSKLSLRLVHIPCSARKQLSHDVLRWSLFRKYPVPTKRSRAESKSASPFHGRSCWQLLPAQGIKKADKTVW